MSYPQGGYQQQPQQPWQQGGQQGGGQQGGYGQQGGQQGGYGQGGGGYNYPAQSSGNAATAIIAGILGIVAAILVVISAIKYTTSLGDGVSLGDLPGEFTTIVISLYAAGVICVIGAIITFVRKIAGAFILVFGAIVVAAAILLQPALVSSAVEGLGGAAPSFGDFFSELFKFDDTVSACEASALICAPLILIFAVIPPTLNWLRSSGAAAHGGYQQQQGGYQQW
jgi:hypothetical protein